MGVPTQSRGKGGYLNNTSGVIQKITFKLGKKGVSKKGRPWQSYSAVALILPDGATKAVEQYMNAGFLPEGNTVSKDGRTIEGTGVFGLDPDTQFYKFVVSLVEGEGTRFPQERLGEFRNYEAVDGTRVTFSRVEDPEETKRRGPRRDEKTGKDYPRDYLLVKEVLELPSEKKAAGKKAASPKAKATVAAAKAEAATVAPAGDLTAQADEAIKSILTGVENRQIERGKLASAFIKYSLATNLEGKAREDLRKFLLSDEYVADAIMRDLIVVNGEGKSAVLILAVTE